MNPITRLSLIQAALAGNLEKAGFIPTNTEIRLDGQKFLNMEAEQKGEKWFARIQLNEATQIMIGKERSLVEPPGDFIDSIKNSNEQIAGFGLRFQLYALNLTSPPRLLLYLKNTIRHLTIRHLSEDFGQSMASYQYWIDRMIEVIMSNKNIFERLNRL